jgi:sec-independent protein translocase protein TatB
MFDLGWSELLVVGVVALVVLGPKELPNALRTVSNLTRTARKLAGEFQSGINEIVREAELEDARKVAQSISKGSISQAIEKVVDPTGEMKSTVTGVEKELKDTKQISPVGPIPPSPTIAATPPASPAIAAPELAKDAEAPEAAAPKAEAKV